MSSSKKLKGLGMNVELYHKDTKSLDIYIKSLNELGVEWVRLMFDFLHPMETKVYEYFIQKCKKNHIKILGLLINNIHGLIRYTFLPQIFSQTKPIFDDKVKFNTYVKNVVKRFKKYITHWQILNEVNTIRFWVKSPNAEEYTEFLSDTKRLINSIDSKAKIVFGSVLGNDENKLMPFQPRHFFRDAMKIGAGKYFSIASFHPYFADCYISLRNHSHYLTHFKKNLEKLVQIRERYNKPVWITEFAICPRWVKLNAQEIANVYWESYKLCKQYKIPFFLWQLSDTRRHIYLRGWTERYFGLLTEDLHPKKVYNELVTLVNRR